MAKKYNMDNVGTGMTEMLGKNIFGEKFADDIFKGENTFDAKMASGDTPIMVDIARLYPSPRNPYKVDEACDEMEQLVASIRKEGVINPLIVRKAKSNEGYEIVSGHRRRAACKIAGIKQVPVIVKDLTDEEADCYMVDLNLNRENILPSEKAKAIRLKYDAIKRSIGKPKEGDTRKGKSSEEVAAQMGLGKRSIFAYLRLSTLCEPVLDAIDKKSINMKTGEQLSYLKENVQRAALAGHEGKLYRLDEEKAKIIRSVYEDAEDANPSDIEKLFAPKKKPIEFKVSAKMKKKYFPENMDDTEIEAVIRRLVKAWAEENNPQYMG